MYHPHIQKIEMLKLEKRLDEELYYLRDAPPEYSTIPFDFEPVQFAKGSKVPVNPIKVSKYLIEKKFCIWKIIKS